MLRKEIYELPELPLVLPEFLLRPLTLDGDSGNAAGVVDQLNFSWARLSNFTVNIPNVPSTLLSCDIMGDDHEARIPVRTIKSLKLAKCGCESTSETKTGCRRYAAAPHDPTRGPIHTPSVATRYSSDS